MATQLPKLPDVERLSERHGGLISNRPWEGFGEFIIIRFLSFPNHPFTLQGTNTYLIGRGPSRLLIDTGEGRPVWSKSLQATLASENASVKTALLTHWHPDHIQGVPDLVKLCPDVKVHKHQPDVGEQYDITDGQVFSVEGATLKAHSTPGHTGDHMVFVLEEEGAMFTGDNVLGHGTSVFDDLSVYLSTLAKMQEYFLRRDGPCRAYPGHGAVIDDGKAKIAEYIQHRQQREEEVLHVLKHGVLVGKDEHASSAQIEPKELRAWTPIELVKIIYHDVPENLHLPAAYGVTQVLKKLEGDGGVVRESEGKGEERFRVVV
ncbi:hypothetical protein AJ79_06139 [Helicocarpus griseus UAMH5409]|uniref:Lactamase-like protein nscB n=1 Tax=Helicocarpus griseus UAMH5409 TaxID=1447875 RepID=A0A2B7XGN2_9EURO|nr:hypothetical protein AJ79_06139 [Helicocarpus griseus UAMH5409]